MVMVEPLGVTLLLAPNLAAVAGQSQSSPSEAGFGTQEDVISPQADGQQM